MSSSHKRSKAAGPSASSSHPPHPALQLEPSLAPHAGLPGVDGTSRFCYGIVAGGGAGRQPGALARAIRKAELAAGARAPAGGRGGGVSLPVGPAIAAEALTAPVGAAATGVGGSAAVAGPEAGATPAAGLGGDTSGPGGTALGFDPATGAYKGAAAAQAAVVGTVVPA